MIFTFGLSGLAAACLFAGLAKAPVSQPYMAENGSRPLEAHSTCSCMTC